MVFVYFGWCSRFRRHKNAVIVAAELRLESVSPNKLPCNQQEGTNQASMLGSGAPPAGPGPQGTREAHLCYVRVYTSGT